MEIERKFLLPSLPPLEPSVHIMVYQIYISTNPEVRVSRQHFLSGEKKGLNKYKLTVKGCGDLVREEFETAVSEEFFNEITRFVGKPPICKDYRKYYCGGHVLECSVVDPGTEHEFMYGEVEFSTEEAAIIYEWPFDGATDVTFDPTYKMKNYWERTRLNPSPTIGTRYQKKPVIVDAILFTRDSFDDVVKFTNGAAHSLLIERCPNGKCTCVIPTLEGKHIANEGDYIIRGVKGEYYPCKPDIFKQTYTEANEKPLTLDELRQMNEQPVYWKSADTWGIVHIDENGRWKDMPFLTGCWHGVNFDYDIERRKEEMDLYRSKV